MRPCLPLLIVCCLLTGASLRAAETKIWGQNGEAWTPASPLPDFSHAGYRAGTSEPELPKAQVSVKKFGAVGDGKADDSEAILKAVAAAPGKVIFFPEGRYVIKQIIRITQSGTVLQGDGVGRTTLLMPTPMNTIAPRASQTTEGVSTTSYSWSGGMISFVGKGYAGEALTTVTSPAKRGDVALSVAEVGKLKTGGKVLLELSDTPAQTLLAHVYRGDTGDMSKLKDYDLTQVLTVTKVEGKTVTFDRPLRSDVNTEWNPQLKRYAPTLENCGLEQLTIEFPATTYRGHWKEDGFNPVDIRGAADCWVRNIKVVNPDSGPFVASSVFCTVEGIELVSSRKAEFEDIQGHHGITIEGVDCLCRNFVISMKFFHDLTLSHGSTGNVFSKGTVKDLAMDHHRYAPYENLFTEIDGGVGTRMWTCGGGAGLGKHTAAGAVFWNIKTKQDIALPPADFAPDGGLVLAGLNVRARKSEMGKNILETANPGNIEPANLHDAQVARRRGQASGPKPALASTSQDQGWTNASGQTIRARFVRLDGTNVTLMKDGRTFTVPLSTLSPVSVTQAQALEKQRLAR